MAATPTQRAERYFALAKQKIESTNANAYGEGIVAGELREGLALMTEGLSQLAAGMRATYMYLEDMQKSIDQIRRTLEQQGRGPR